jgi:hypothetical protein
VFVKVAEVLFKKKEQKKVVETDKVAAPVVLNSHKQKANTGKGGCC